METAENDIRSAFSFVSVIGKWPTREQAESDLDGNRDESNGFEAMQTGINRDDYWQIWWNILGRQKEGWIHAVCQVVSGFAAKTRL